MHIGPAIVWLCLAVAQAHQLQQWDFDARLPSGSSGYTCALAGAAPFIISISCEEQPEQLLVLPITRQEWVFAVTDPVRDGSCALFTTVEDCTHTVSEELLVVEPPALVPEQRECVLETCSSRQHAIGPNCESCVPGYVRALDSCTPCAVDSFSANYGSTACVACEAGTSTLGFAGQSRCWGCALTATHCTACVAGLVLRPDSSGCDACEPGTFSRYGDQACTACLPGAFAADTGRSACAECEAGTYASANGSTACAVCPPYSNSTTSGADGCACIPGSVLDSSGTRCVPCLAGYYFSDAACRPCPAGTFAAAAGALACDPCPPRHYALEQGSSQCSLCDGIASPTTCMCPNGTFSRVPADGLRISDPASQCSPCTVACGPQLFAVAPCSPVAGDLQCQACTAACPAKYYMTAACAAAKDIACERCSTRCLGGFFMSSACDAENDLTCTLCGTTCPPGSAIARPCSALADIQCTACPLGTFSDGTLFLACQRCPESQITLAAGATACTPCPGDAMLTDAQQTRCFARCPVGTYPAGHSTCAPCPPMTYGPTGDGCISCLGGNFFVSGASACEPYLF
jgi:hypothetical protein